MSNQQRDKAVTIIPDYIASAAQSTSFTTNSYDITQFSKYAFQLLVTSASGLSVKAKAQSSLDNTNWDDVPGSEITITTNGAYFWDNLVSCATWVRINLSFSGGSGSAKFQCYAFAKL